VSVQKKALSKLDWVFLTPFFLFLLFAFDSWIMGVFNAALILPFYFISMGDAV